MKRLTLKALEHAMRFEERYIRNRRLENVMLKWAAKLLKV